LLHRLHALGCDQAGGLIAPIFQQGFIWGVEGFAYVGPPEDLKLK
jgi:hypothetical protein